MKLVIHAPWRKTKEETEDDKKYLKNLFQLNHSFGLEGSPDWNDDGERVGYTWRATADIETEDYNIHGAQK